jgi:transcriptional regulator with XRE-family HTH domain
MKKKIVRPVDAYVGGRVRDRRKDLGMSQTALAEAIGFTFQQVQKYEKGTNRMGSSRLVEIATVLKVAPTYFFEGAPGQRQSSHKFESPDYITGFVSSADGLRFIRAFQKITSADLRRSIVVMVDKIADEE